MVRPVGSGAAWRRSPHQKSAGREREKGKRREERKKRGERKERRKGKGRERRGEQETEKDVLGIRALIGHTKLRPAPAWPHLK